MWITDDISVEAQLMAFIVPMTIAMEVGAYFIYQYIKTRHARLKLNRVLLSYGTLTLLMVWGILLLVLRRVLGLEGEVGDMLFTAGFVMVCATPLGFLGFIATRDLSTIMNVTLARVLLALSVAPMIVIVVAGTRSPWFPPSMIFTVTSAVFLIHFQVKMIKLALGRLKTKLIQLFAGEITALSSLVFATNASFGFMTFMSPEMSFFIATIILTVGFLLLFWAANDFPPFYEFEWRFNLSKLFIVDARDYTFLFAHDFEASGDGNVMDDRDELYSGAISGIESMIGSITGTSGAGTINKIEKEGSIIFVEQGKIPGMPIVYILLVKKDLDSMKSFLQDLRHQFEAFFKYTLGELNLEQPGTKINLIPLFSSFNIILRQMVA